MRKVTFKGLDPEDLHTCQHCQHHFHDIGMNRKVCSESGQPIAPMDFISMNDCEEYKSPCLSNLLTQARETMNDVPDID